MVKGVKNETLNAIFTTRVRVTDSPVHLACDADEVELADEHGEESLEAAQEGGEALLVPAHHQVAAEGERHEHRAEDDPEAREVRAHAL